MRESLYIRVEKLAFSREKNRPIRRRKGLLNCVPCHRRAACPLKYYLNSPGGNTCSIGELKKSAEDKRMNIKKTGTSLAIVFSMLAFNAAAQADCTEEIDHITQAADNLRCTLDQSKDFGDAAGLWDHAPIWQKAAGKGKNKQDAVTDGCETHQSIAKKLYEEREFSDDKRPPRNKNNLAAGAAQQLKFGKFQAALDSLTAIELAVDESVVNPDFGTLVDPWNNNVDGDAEYWATRVKAFATEMKTRIDPELGCY